jgi:hypothetical protein
MKRLCRTGVVISLFMGLCAAQSGTGSVCVASRADDPFRGQVIPPTGEVDSHGLRVRIDKGRVTPWPQRKSLKIDELDLAERHLLTVLDARGKPAESLWFRFSQFKSNQLCMSYDEYQGVQLTEDTRHTPWCKCKEQSK